MLPYLALGLACQLLIAGAAQAEPTDEDARAQARALFNEGVSAYEAERYEAALAAFQEAYRLAPHPLVRVNMANCYDELDRPIEAIFHFEQFLEEAGDDATRRQRREVRAALRRLHERVGKLSLDVAPDGATVRIDDDHVLEAPLLEPVALAQGLHVVEVSHPDHATVRREVEIPGGGSASLFLRLERQAPAVAAAPETSATPPQASEAAGAPEHAGARETAAEAPAAAAPPAPVESADRGGLRLSTRTLLVGGLSAALGIAATVTGLLALQEQRTFDERSVDAHNPDLPSCQRGDVEACLDEQNDAWADAHNAATRADGLALATDILIGGAVLGGIATVTLFVMDQSAQERRVAVTPQLSPTRASLQLQGSF